MYARLNIPSQGMLLLAVPLVLQAACIGVLFRTEADASRAQAWAFHTKAVIAKATDIDRTLLESHSSVRNTVLLGDRSAGALVRNALERIPKEIEELGELVGDNPPQRARTRLLAVESRPFLRWLGAQEQLSRSRQRESSLAQAGLSTVTLGKVRALIDEILREEDALDRQRMSAVEQSMGRQVWTTAAVGAVIIAATVVLAVLFLRRIVRRLAFLRDSARRLSEGKSLLGPLAGADEIAEVDRVFRETAAKLEQEKQDNEMFVYSVSHDLRSPLVNLQGFSQELRMTYEALREIFQHEEMPGTLRQRGIALLSEGVGEPIRYIQTAVGRLSRIIDGLLRLSRAGRVEYQWQEVDTTALVQRVLEALHASISAKQAQIVVPDLPGLWGDPAAIEQIFANLIDNAVQYLDPARPGRIEVGSVQEGPTGMRSGLHILFVKDNGLGIPAAYQARIFSAFSRLHADAPHGEGVGLALVRRMVARHGGDIWLESSAGAGTTFFVALPFCPSNSRHKEPEEIRALEETSKGAYQG